VSESRVTTPTAQLLDALLGRLRDAYAYVFPNRADAACELLRRRLAAGAYPEAIGPEVCEQLSRDLYEACRDKHLRLIWHESVEASVDEGQLVAALRAEFARENQGIRRVERLPGNVGLIGLTIIPEASTGAPALTAAMQLVHHTEALILDLRHARGGSPDGVAYLASYFFPDGETHLGDFVEGEDRRTRQFWTSAYLPAPRYLDRCVFALTGAATFSGGEALAYDLQAHGRAVVAGAATGGGAHPSEVVSLVEHVELRLPIARPVNAVTGANWEGTGVRPDVEVDENEALSVAHRLALEAIVRSPASSQAAVSEALQACGTYE
jgi:C-terminal processing protease CtpA/Prc